MSKKLKILFLTCSLERGGSERIVVTLCDEWARSGHEVKLLTTFSGVTERAYDLSPLVAEERLVDRVESQGRSLLNRLRRIASVRELIRTDAPDVIVSFQAHVNVLALLASSGLRTPVVISERIYPPRLLVSPSLSAARRVLYGRATALVMQTEQGCAWARRRFPCLKTVAIANPVVNPLPLGMPEIRPPAPQTGPILLAVGRLVPQKGFDRLVEAFALVAKRHPSVSLFVLGEGPDRLSLADAVAAHGISTRVFFPGAVGNVGAWYRRANVFALSSRFEGFPNALLEAMSYGVPCIAIDCETGPRDIINHGIDGFLVKDGSTEALASALDLVLGNDKLADTLGSNARSKVLDQFAPARIAAEWLELFKEVVHKQPLERT